MKIIGSITLPLVFEPENRARSVRLKIVDGLPYGCILGAAFFRANGSTLSFTSGHGFKPSPDAP